MSKMKRSLCMVLAVVFALALMMAGCGANQAANQAAKDAAANDAETGAAAADSVAEAAPAGPPTTLTWYCVGPGQEPDTDAVMAEVNKYLKDKLNVDLKMNVLAYGDAYNQKVNTMLSAGEPFDICFTASWAADIKLNSSKGYFTE